MHRPHCIQSIHLEPQIKYFLVCTSDSVNKSKVLQTLPQSVETCYLIILRIRSLLFCEHRHKIKCTFFFFLQGVRHCSCHNHHHYYNYDDFSDDDYDDYTDEDSDDEFWESIASRLRNKWEARKFMQKGNS